MNPFQALGWIRLVWSHGCEYLCLPREKENVTRQDLQNLDIVVSLLQTIPIFQTLE